MNRRDLLKGLLGGTAAAIVLPGDEVVRRFWRGWAPPGKVSAATIQESIDEIWRLVGMPPGGPLSRTQFVLSDDKPRPATVEMRYRVYNETVQTVTLREGETWIANEDTLILGMDYAPELIVPDDPEAPAFWNDGLTWADIREAVKRDNARRAPEELRRYRETFNKPYR